jgi:hypothetical protein
MRLSRSRSRLFASLFATDYFSLGIEDTLLRFAIINLLRR